MRPLTLALTLLLTLRLPAQAPWTPSPGATFHESAEQMLQWLNSTPPQQRPKGWKQAARFYTFWESRVPPGGTVADAVRAHNQYLQDIQHQHTHKTSSANWDNLGFPNPMNLTRGARTNCIAVHPVNTSTLYVGSPGGGLWRTFDGGQLWAPLTDQIASIGVSAVAIDPSNPDILYIGTGDRDGLPNDLSSHIYSSGIHKSTDAGLTWATTGFSRTGADSALIARLSIDRAATSNLIAASTAGIHRSTDGGTSWTTVATGNFRELLQDKTTATRWYAATTNTVHYSTDNGTTWNPAGTGLPTDAARIALAVTAANPNYVYAILTNSTGNDYGVYRSTDMGLSFSPRNLSPNVILQQGTYNLCIEASDTDPEKLYAAGVTIYRSDDGGASWTGNQPSSVDFHDLALTSTGELYALGDQGVFLTTDQGVTWESRNAWMDVSQHYRLGVGQGIDPAVCTGLQDNGIRYYLGGNWYSAGGADAQGSAIDQIDPNYMYVADYGALLRSTNMGTTWTSATPFNAISEGTNWILPVTTGPLVTGEVIAARTNVYRSTDHGLTWSPISSFPTIGTPLITRLRIAPSSSGHIYALTRRTLQRTTDGGTTWQDITAGIDRGTRHLSDVWVHHTNPDIAWVSIAGHDPNRKVFKTNDGGSTWHNISPGFPNLNINTGIHAPGSGGDFYLGTDDGVWRYDDFLNTYTWFNDYMPRAVVLDFGINTHWNQLYAATNGRGIWFTPLAPVASQAPAPPTPRLQATIHPLTHTWTLRLHLDGCTHARLRIHDLQGRTLHDISPALQDTQLRDISAGWPAGLYLAILETDLGTSTAKILVPD